jgi:predicted membrane channel-forming protein YqfA (hemolysin III family)
MKKLNRTRRFFLFLVGGAMPVMLTLGIIFQLSTILITALLLVMGVIFASMWLWYQANLRANGDEWWQDDEASGWRGY